MSDGAVVLDGDFVGVDVVGPTCINLDSTAVDSPLQAAKAKATPEQKYLHVKYLYKKCCTYFSSNLLGAIQNCSGDTSTAVSE